MEPADDAGYASWGSNWPDDWIALDAARTTAFNSIRRNSDAAMLP